MTQVLAELSSLGIKATLNEHTGGIQIPEYHYDIAYVYEKTSKYGFRPLPTGKLYVDFRSVHFGLLVLQRAKSFEAKGKNLIKRIVEDIQTRRNSIIAQRKKERSEEKVRRAQGLILKNLRETYPEFKWNIEEHNSEINLTFKSLTEDEARLILMTLRNAGINSAVAGVK